MCTASAAASSVSYSTKQQHTGVDGFTFTQRTLTMFPALRNSSTSSSSSMSSGSRATNTDRHPGIGFTSPPPSLSPAATPGIAVDASRRGRDEMSFGVCTLIGRPSSFCPSSPSALRAASATQNSTNAVP